MRFDSETGNKGWPQWMIPGKRLRQRRSIRLKGYDYSSAGAYFVTLCTEDRECLFGEISAGEMILNDAGRMARKCWNDIPAHFLFVELDEFVVMPNHLHGILWITNAAGVNMGVGANAEMRTNTNVGAKNISPLPTPHPSTMRQPHGTSRTIGSIVRGFKIGVTKWMRQNNVIDDVWQRNYHEHIVRDEDDLNRIRQYIQNNPLNWQSDDLFAGRA